MEPFTIKTFFPDGDPSGFRISEITNQTIQAFYIPRDVLKRVVQNREELSWNGVYTLFDSSLTKGTVYIGEAEDVGRRLNQHLNNEPWWTIAVAFVVNNRDHQLSKADIKYLENLMYQKADKANIRELYNGNTPHKSFVEESRRYDLKNIFEKIDLLLNSFGFSVFSNNGHHDNLMEVNDYLYMNGRDSDATGIYNSDGSFTVKKGSRVSPLKITKSFSDSELLKDLEDSNVLNNDTFQRGYKFHSPSQAARIIYKSSANGLILWHDHNGKTLKELYKN